MAKPLEYYGMDSMQAMHLSGDLAEWLGKQLSPTVVWDYPTIELLANHLAKKRVRDSPSTVRLLALNFTIDFFRADIVLDDLKAWEHNSLATYILNRDRVF